MTARIWRSEPPSPAPWKRLAQLLRPQRRRMAAGFALSLLASLSGIALLTVSGHFITSMALVGAGGAAINYYTPAALVRLFAIVRTGGRYGERLVTHDATLAILAHLRGWLFARLVPLAPARLGRTRSAEFLSRLRADIDTLEHAYLGLLLPSAVAACACIGVIMLAAIWSVPASMVLAGMLALGGIALPAWLHRRNGPSVAQVDREAERLRAEVADVLAGRAELALFGAEMVFDVQLETTVARREAVRHRSQQLQAMGEAVLTFLVPLTVVAVLALGLSALRAHALDGPGLTSLVLMGVAAFEPIFPLPAAWARLEAIRAAAARVFKLADTTPAIVDPVEPMPLPDGNDLHVRDVWMRHDECGGWALDGLSLDVPAGTRLAIVGASGAGKSSLARVLGRLYPYQGSIRLGGTSLDQLTGDDVRSRIAIVEQHPYLFDGSLRDNLRVAAPEASDAQLHSVLTTAQLSGFLAALPDGLDTWVGSLGVNVSGGEARRIAIARALLVDAPILLLDEPTEGLDAATASALYTALAQATEGRSLILITHHLGALAAVVDEVATMEGGRIVERRPVAEYQAGLIVSGEKLFAVP